MIIVTYNSEKHIYDCLSSIYHNNDIGDLLEVIIVDNDSHNQTLMFESVSQLYPQVRLIDNPQNEGYGQGNNIGVKNSFGDIILIMNPDVRMVEPIFKRVIEYFEHNAGVALLGMKQWHERGKEGLSFDVDSSYSFLNPVLCAIKSRVYNRFNIFDNRDMYINGSCFFIRKQPFIRVGMFDENIFMYCEEKDLNRRLKDHGYKISFDKDLSYFHLVGGRSLSYGEFKRTLDSELYYYCKNNLDKITCLKKKLSLFKFMYFLNRIRFMSQANFSLGKAIHECKHRIDEIKKQ